MANLALFVLVSALCYLGESATYFHEFDVNEDDPLALPEDTGFSETHPWKIVVHYKEPRIRARRQIPGGVIVYPGGETRRINYSGKPFWGSISQTASSRGFTSPITYSGGATFSSPAGHGLSGKLDVKPGIGGTGSIRGQVGIVNTPNHQVTGWAQHNRNLDKNFNIVGRETNSGGLTYTNMNNGVGASVSGSHTPGQPNRGSAGVNVPLATGNGGRTKLEATGQAKFGQEMKPEQHVGLKLTHKF